jgi:ureidoglycolate lyase
MREIRTQPLTLEAFAPFGQVLDLTGEHYFINRGRGRRHDVGRVTLAGESWGRISLVHAEPVALPHTLDLVERHPLGSQAFHPLGRQSFLVVVAPDEGGKPGTPLAFVTAPGQGINYNINTWHGVLTPLGEASDFIIVDRGGEGPNLEEHHFETPYTVVAG